MATKDQSMEISKSTKPEPTKQVARTKGGLKTMPFIIANESFEKVAGYGLLPNMVFYLINDYHLSVASASNVLFLWNAASNFMPIFGAFFADAYLGRFGVIALGSVASFLGAALLWLTAALQETRPKPCYKSTITSCPSATSGQLLLLYSAFIIMSIGAGGIRPCSIAFGADQFNNPQNPKNKRTLQTFFNLYYASIGVSLMFAVTVIVYIQISAGWIIGFGVPLALMLISAVLFLLGSPYYVMMKANKSLFTGLAQVAVASFKNRKLDLPPKNSVVVGSYYYHHKGSKLIAPTEKLRFLNKACLMRDPIKDLDIDGQPMDPWKLCAVRQVEELKALITVLPIWSTGIMIAVAVNQSFPTVLANTMDRRFIGSFKIPAASFTLFGILTLTVWVTLYDRVIVPLMGKFLGRPRGFTLKQRMGIGLAISCMAMSTAALVEARRRGIAIQEGFLNNPKGVTTMSAMWVIPQHCLGGLAEAFNAIGQIEFYYSQFPKSMASIAVALVTLGMAFGNLLGSLIVSTMNDVTKRGGKVSWVASNMNKGHYDYYFWVIASLSLVNFLYYLVCSWAYGSEESKLWDEEDIKEEEMDQLNGSPKLLQDV